MALRDITKFPHASVMVNVGKASISAKLNVSSRAFLMAKAFDEAVIRFHRKYKRRPDYDILMFRGCHATTGVVCEIWEEE